MPPLSAVLVLLAPDQDGNGNPLDDILRQVGRVSH